MWVHCAAFVVLLGCGSSGSTRATTETVSPANSLRASPTDPSRASGTDVSLEVDAIAAAINTLGPDVHTCWSRAAADDYQLEGRVLLGVTMAAEGQSTVELLQEDVEDRVLSDCLVQIWSNYQWPSVFAPGDSIQLPPFEFVAPEAQYVVTSSYLSVREERGGMLRTRTVLEEKNTGNSQVHLSLLSVGDGGVVPMRSHAGSEFFYVFSGTGIVESKGKKHQVTTGNMVAIPANTTYQLHSVGGESIEFVKLSLNPEFTVGTPQRQVSRVANVVGHKGNGRQSLSRLRVVTSNDAQTRSIMAGMGTVRVFVDLATRKTPSVSASLLEAKTQGVVAPHIHQDSSEILFVLAGEAEMTVSGKTVSVRAGDGVQIPPKTLHGAKIVGSESFSAVQFFVPVEREQRFKGKSP